MRSLDVTIVAPSMPLVNIQAQSVMAPGESGYFGCLPGREPLIATLGIGLVHVKDQAKTDHWFAVTGGFFEMIEDKVTVLADSLVTVPTAEMPEHLKGKGLYFAEEYSSDVQKNDLARALLWKKIHPGESHG